MGNNISSRKNTVPPYFTCVARMPMFTTKMFYCQIFETFLHFKITIFSYSETVNSSHCSQVVFMLGPQWRDHMIKDIR